MAHTPAVIGRYQVLSRIGQGGVGGLLLAWDPILERQIAIKLLQDDDDEVRKRFAREARSVARLRHPNIVTVFDVGEQGGQLFIAMEYIVGLTLDDVIRTETSIDLPGRLQFVIQLCEGLAHAHAAGIIHRDIKPANIMLDLEGVVKILDFGIARLASSQGMTQDGITLNYMSPEQVVGRGVDHRSDIFAAGAVLYELVALEQAFPGGIDTGVLNRILSEGPVPLGERVPGVDPDLAGIVQHALEREPTRRYQDASAMRRDIARVRHKLLQAGHESAAASPRDPTVVLRPSSQDLGLKSDGDRRRLDPQRLAELRRQQVEEHLRFGEEAFAKGDHDAARQYAERAAAVDPDNRAAFDLIDKARFGIESKAIRQMLAEAQRLLSDGHLDGAAALAEEASVTLPGFHGADELSSDVRQLAETIAAAQEREKRIAGSLERASTAIDQTDYETALRAVYEVLALDPERADARELEQLAQSRLQAKRAGIEDARRQQQELEQKRHVLETALTETRALVERGDLARALELVEDAARLGLDDGRIPAIRREIVDRGVVSEERRRQEAGDQLAMKRVEAARQLLANGDGYAAVALLERDGSGHPLVEAALREIRMAVAEQEEHVRREAEHRRQEQEAHRSEGARRVQEQEARRLAEVEARAREQALAGIPTRVDGTPQHEEALRLLREAETLLPGDPRVRALIAQRIAALERERAEEQRRRQEARNDARREEERLEREEQPPSPPSPRPDRALHLDDNVQFTVYRPKAIQTQQWYPLLAFAHLSELPPESTNRRFDPVEEVHRQAQQTLGDLAEDYRKVAQDSLRAVPRGGELTFCPEISGIEFNPPRSSFVWQEPVHKAEFRLRALPESEAGNLRGRLTVLLGSIILAEVSLSIRLERHDRAPDPDPLPAIDSARPYRRIFPSYSHRDLAVVEEFERHARATGDRYLRDLVQLRAGEHWQRSLIRMIDDADLFQLFWSWNSMASDFVRQEWNYALSLNRPQFVRPVYWEEPLPQRAGLPPVALRNLHFQQIYPATGASPPLPVTREEVTAGMHTGPSAVTGSLHPVPAPPAEIDTALVDLERDLTATPTPAPAADRPNVTMRHSMIAVLVLVALLVMLWVALTD